MADFLRGLVAFVLVLLASQFGALAWRLYRMPHYMRRELQENYERRKNTQRMIKFWLSSGKIKS